MLSPQQRRPYLLVVDDDAGVREVLASLLVDEGYRCATADGANHALAMVRGEPFDLILSDLKMPEGDGLWLLDQLQRQELGLPVIILTGHGEPEEEAECRRRGAAGFLLKPPDVSELIAAIEKILEPRKA